jgi:RNA polymerase sigma-70 factor (ECF subfamily)
MEATRNTLLMRVRDPTDAAAWGEFVALYEPLLMAYARKRGLRDDDARDVTQDVFARLVKALPSFRLDHQRGRFRTWLWSLFHSAMADWARRQRRQDRAREAWLKRLGESTSADADSDVEWRALHRQRVLAYALERARARSRPATWACFERHLLQGRPSAAVAEELNVSDNAVNLNSSRVLARVRAFCSEYLEGLADDVDPLPGGP